MCFGPTENRRRVGSPTLPSPLTSTLWLTGSQALTDLLPKVEEVRLPGESPLLVPLLNGQEHCLPLAHATRIQPMA